MFLISIVLTTYLTIIYSFNTSPVDQEGRTIADMIASDLRTTELSERLALLGTRLTERIAEFEKTYIQRITTLETKLEIYTNELENNNRLEVSAEMMKIVMELQKKIGNTEIRNIEKQHTLSEIKIEVSELNRIVKGHAQKIQNFSDDMHDNRRELEATIQQMSQFSQNSTYNDKLTKLNDRINELRNVYENNTNFLTDNIQGLIKKIQNVSDDMLDNKYELEMQIQQQSNHSSFDDTFWNELNHQVNGLRNMYENNTNALRKIKQFLIDTQHSTETFSITFSTCGKITGTTGPTLSDCRGSYSGILLKIGTYFSVKEGVQIWQVPETGNYIIEAAGAAGGNGNGNTGTTTIGGKSAKIKGIFYLKSLTVLNIVVGQMGDNGDVSEPGGGGGGTFVYKGNMGGPGLLIAAGGGGGAGEENTRGGYDGWGGEQSFSASGTVGVIGKGGIGGNITTAGAGWLGDGGVTVKREGNHGTRWQGGVSPSTNVGAGGFGGGGSGVSGEGGGGGGGYTGGQGQNFISETNRHLWGGSGGGSYNSGRNQENITGYNDGAGYVIITKLL